jgi:hypothetical protein
VRLISRPPTADGFIRLTRFLSPLGMTKASELPKRLSTHPDSGSVEGCSALGDRTAAIAPDRPKLPRPTWPETLIRTGSAGCGIAPTM